jgi:hypothetical protein
MKIELLVKEHLIEANVYIIHVVVNVFELLLDHNRYHLPILQKKDIRKSISRALGNCLFIYTAAISAFLSRELY